MTTFLPVGPACLRYCLSARTGPRASPSIPSMCHKNMRECLLNSAGITTGQRAGRYAQTSSLHPVSHPAPGEIGATQEEHMARTHEREVGTSHIPSCFLLLKLHCLLQCKKYPESGEEYLIYNVSAYITQTDRREFQGTGPRKGTTCLCELLSQLPLSEAQ